MGSKYESGQEDGRQWAKTAKKAEVRRLDRAVRKTVSVGSGPGSPGEFVGFCNNGCNSGSAIGIWAAIRGERDHIGQDASDLWEEVLGEKGWQKTADDDEYATGFIEGALESMTAG